MEEELEITNFNKNTIEDILSKQDVKYSVSYFQRDYSWGKDEWSKLLDDIFESLSERRKHFFGFMTFFKPNIGNEIQIIEGQQRLATVTILAAAIRDIFMEKKDGKWKEIDTQLVKTKDIYSEEIFDKLGLSDINRDFFKEYIQREGKAKEKTEKMRKEKRLKSSNRLIRDCYNYFYDKLKSQRLLLDILRQATREFIVITTEVTNLRSAYILFQTLNNRGLDLTLSDLLKTHLLQKSGEDWKDTKKDWDYILSFSGIDNMNIFLRHYWLSTRGIVKEEELFDKFSSEIKNREDAHKFIRELKKEAELYSVLLNPEASNFSGNKIIVELLKDELYVLSKQQVLPLLLALCQKLDLKNEVLVVKSLINFIFRYLTIGEQENKELERLFSEIARSMRQNKIKNATQVVKELKKKDINNETFHQLFKIKQIKDNKKVVYILAKIEQFLSEQKEKFATDITLEHILPVNPDNECKQYMIDNKLWDDKDEWVYRIGNMTLLLSKPNKKAQNRSPIIKSREIYKKETKLKINKDLKNIIKWSQEAIEKRQKRLANYAVKIWKL